jgi:hypothetical protein
MSFSKDSSIQTFFTLSMDSENLDERSEPETLLLPNQQKKMIQELLMEIDLINEDRQRLKRENEILRKKTKKSKIKDVQIELLSKIATKALELNYTNRFTVLSQSPMRKINCKIKIKSPSQGSPCRVLNSFFIPTPGNLATEISSASSSPLKSNRTTSSKIRVSRNYLKYPK